MESGTGPLMIDLDGSTSTLFEEEAKEETRDADDWCARCFERRGRLRARENTFGTPPLKNH